MALHKDEAIVLFKRAYGESDKIIRLFTLTSGKVAAIAKGGNKSQKRFMNTLEPFNHIKVEYFEKHGKGMVRLENADIVETNSGIETSLHRVCTASFFTEFVDRLTKERERHDSLFHTLKEILTRVKDAEFTFDDILYYQLKMLEILGYMPNFSACVYCGKEVVEDKKIYFSKERGGILCHKCYRYLPHKEYPKGVIPGLAAIKNMFNGSGFGSTLRNQGSEKFSVQEKTEGYRAFDKEMREIMEEFISFHLDVELKSYRVLKNIVF